MPTTAPGVGRRIEIVLRELRMTRTALAAAVGVSRHTVHRALAKDQITRQVAEQVAAALGVESTWLLRGTSAWSNGAHDDHPGVP